MGFQYKFKLCSKIESIVTEATISFFTHTPQTIFTPRIFLNLFKMNIIILSPLVNLKFNWATICENTLEYYPSLVNPSPVFVINGLANFENQQWQPKFIHSFYFALPTCRISSDGHILSKPLIIVLRPENIFFIPMSS